MQILTAELKFPPINTADADGLVALGGDLSIERLLFAYQSGIFPWFNDGEIIQWYSPNPRFVLFPAEIKISKSMQQVLRKNAFTFTINKAFAQVIAQCKLYNRKGQDGTWITNEMEVAYNEMHKKGIAISAETWCNNELVGGLYGIYLGKIFCGESMFALQSNASKFAFIKLVQQLQLQGLQIIDCQIFSEHLASLGARMITRENFANYLVK